MDAATAGYVFLAMNMAERALRAADKLQQRHAWLAVPVAVWKKFGDDQAGNLAALIAYSALVAIFPLLLVLLTVLEIVLKNNEELKQTVQNALDKYPAIALVDQSIGRLNQTGIALAVGLVGTFIGSLGVANSLQNALNSVWEIPFARRPGFPWSWLRSAALIIVIGLGFIATTILSGLAAGTGRVLLGAGSSVLAFAVAFGGYFLSHQLAHASPLYGTFALVLGLIAWLYLQAQLTLYAVEINVVRAYRLWPRSLAPPPYTEQDRHAFRLYVEKRGDQWDIVMRAGGEDDREKTSG